MPENVAGIELETSLCRISNSRAGAFCAPTRHREERFNRDLIAIITGDYTTAGWRREELRGAHVYRGIASVHSSLRADFCSRAETWPRSARSINGSELTDRTSSTQLGRPLSRAQTARYTISVSYVKLGHPCNHNRTTERRKFLASVQLRRRFFAPRFRLFARRRYSNNVSYEIINSSGNFFFIILALAK